MALDLLRSSIDFVKSLPEWFTRGSVLLTFGAVATGLLLPASLATNSDSVIRTIATVQASGYGIILSVTVLGAQLIANRYSPQIAELITDSDLLRFSFILISCSIVADVVVLQFLPVLRPRATVLLVTGLIAGMLIAGSGLYLFVRETLDRSTPDGLIRAYTDRHDPYEVLRAVESNETPPHPLSDFYQFIRSAIRNHELEIAEIGIQEYEELGTTTIEELTESGHFSLRDENARGLFRPPLRRHLPRIVEGACEHDELDLADDAIRAQQTLGETAANCSRGHVATLAIHGLRRTHQRLPEDSWGKYRDIGSADARIINSLAEIPDPRALSSGLSSYKEVVRISLIRDVSEWTQGRLCREYYRRGIDSSLGTVLTRYEEYITDLEVDWSQEFAPEDRGDAELLRLLFKYHGVTVDIANQLFHFYDEYGHFPGDTQPMRLILEVCDTVAESGSPEYAAQYFHVLIDCAYVERGLEAGPSDSVLRRLDDLASSYPRVARLAFAQAREQGRTRLLFSWEGHSNLTESAPSGNLVERLVASRDSSPYEDWVDSLELELIGTPD